MQYMEVSLPLNKNTLLRTNFVVCVIIIIGFLVTSYVSYSSNFGIYEQDVERVSVLAEEGIFHKIDAIFSQPVNVSLTIANDSLLKDFLSQEQDQLLSHTYITQLREYLDTYRMKYSYDSVFLVSAATNRYYHFNGLDRVLAPEQEEDVWYYHFLDGGQEFSLNVDNDQAADNEITVFVNCKITDATGATMGVVGVGLKVDQLQAILGQYSAQYGVTAMLVDEEGIIQLSPEQTGYEGVELFSDPRYTQSRARILGDRENIQAFWYPNESKTGYLVTQYVPNLQWYLVVENNVTVVRDQLQQQLMRNVLVLLFIVTAVLVTITGVIRTYNQQILQLTIGPELEYERLLHEATVGLYEHVFEWNVSKDKPLGEAIHRYLAYLGIAEGASYDAALLSIAHSQIKEEFIQGYLDTFCRAHVLEVYASGVNNLSYDFMSRSEGSEEYHWIHLSCRIFYWASDQSVRMLSYRKDIDEEKCREIRLLERSRRDTMTGLYNKGATEDLMTDALNTSTTEGRFVLMLFDIDDFKQVNDRWGHIFGDEVIVRFASLLQTQFRETDIVGRVGGDEFAVLMRDQDDHELVRRKLAQFCDQLGRHAVGDDQGYTISASIGAAFFPEQCGTYRELYEKADQALYTAKKQGKGGCWLSGEMAQDLP